MAFLTKRRRRKAVRLLFWHHERAAWMRGNLRQDHYVWPPFPREDEFRRERIAAYAATVASAILMVLTFAPTLYLMFAVWRDGAYG